MSFRAKLFAIIGLSQIILVSLLVFSFVILIEKVKNEPQDLRAFELASQFEKELKLNEERYKNFILDLKLNQNLNEKLKLGFKNREYLKSNSKVFKDLMKKNNLSIFELIDKSGKVFYRFHREADFGDDKSDQKIVQKAFQSEPILILESGHSGLGLRYANKFEENVILIGEVVNSEFLDKLSSSESEIAIFDNSKLISFSSEKIKNYSEKYSSYKDIPAKKRIKVTENYFYTVKLPYTNNGLTNLNLEFLILIDETNLNSKTNLVWLYFTIFTFTIFSLIFFISFLFSRDITRAVKSLNFAMANIDEDEKKILNLERKDEIGQMSNVFVQMKEELISHQHNLEDKIDKKTAELQESLAQVNKLRFQQDGDYFLTSLLIDPLMKKTYANNLVSVNSVVKQKKSFEFKGKNVEIGGDICVADKIVLRGEEYTLFLNGDAMGKSLQGASGVLVIGTVFKAMIQNTEEIAELNKKYPEIWLYDCYDEIQKVFLSFNGSMLISCIVGLIHNETGSLYYFNAEHPFLILYRDKVANYVDKEIHIRKIGLEKDDSMPFKVFTFQLESGDSVIIGTDGKDEIMLKDKNNEEQVNTDEQLILDTIQILDADLVKIKESIFTNSRVIDDFAMMKITFDENYKLKRDKISSKINENYKKAVDYYKIGNLTECISILEKLIFDNPNAILLKKQLAKVYFKNQNYLQSIRMSEDYLRYFPLDNKILEYTSYSYFKLDKMQNGIDILKRISLREPENFRIKEMIDQYKVELTP